MLKVGTQFAGVINQLVQEVEALRASIGQLMETISFHRRFNDFLLGRFLEESGELVEEEPDGVKSYKVGPAHFGKLKRLERRLTSSAVAESLLPGSLLITLVSRYDAFLGRLIRTMLLTRPELLKSSERTLTQLPQLGEKALCFRGFWGVFSHYICFKLILDGRFRPSLSSRIC